jgi:hypothetical protein
MAGMAAQAAPVTQAWLNFNPDPDFGLFDSLAFRFVSQPGQSGFNNVIVSPFNGWTSPGFDPLLTYAIGTEGKQINFSLVFDGLATDQVQWEVWYYRDLGILGGGRYVGDVGRTAFHFDLLTARNDPPAAVPEPGTLLLAGIALLASIAVMRRRATASRTC